MSSTNRGAVRRDRDAYPTPSWCLEVLIPEIVWGAEPDIWEPAAGDGAISDTLVALASERHGGWYASDIEPKSETVGKDDFLTAYSSYGRWDFVVTNPPFSLAKDFIEASRKVANCVIMLLPLGFYGSEERHEWWKENEPTAQFVLSKRPMFTKNKDGKWGTDSETYAWLVWDTTGRQKRGIFHLNPTDEQYKRSISEFKQRYGGGAV